MMTLKISNRGFNGACVLSAVGSLPMHVMPILIASAILADRVTATQAGLFAAMYSLGQLLITTLLPMLAIRFLRSARVVQVSLLLVVVIVTSAYLSGKLFYLNWFLIGMGCGVLSYLGSTSASAVENKSVAYAIRLGVTLMVAGLTMLVFYALDQYAGFVQLTISLGLVVSVLCVVGLYLYRAPVLEPGRRQASSLALTSKSNIRWGLVYVFIFALAQVGFIVFAVDSAIHRGIEIGEALWVFALCKIFAAGLLLLRHSSKSSSNGNQLLILLIPVIVTACFLVASSQSMLLFFIGILLWETSVNIMSSSFQASVVEANPVVGGMYLTSVLLLGSAIGPVVHGLAISASIQEYFNCLVLVSVFLPLLWERHRGERHSRRPLEPVVKYKSGLTGSGADKLY